MKHGLMNGGEWMRPATRVPTRGTGFSYAVPGVLSWSIAGLTVLGILYAPHAWMILSVLFLVYFVARLGVHFVFYMVGEMRCRAWRSRDWREHWDQPGVGGISPADVWHVVLIPNYTEPDEVLRRTLDGLAAQQNARERIVAVLGMEAREAGALEKGRRLADEYRGRLADVLVTEHPSGLPGELPCKAANMRWSAQMARDEIERRGIDLDTVTITSCDADSLFDRRYFSAVSELFARDSRRHARFWQAPLFYYNNLWQVPAPIRFTAWFTHVGMLAELALPGYDPLPISTYTLSLKLAEECDWWDPAVISEDWHVYLDYLVQRQGDVFGTAVFLPVLSDSVEGPTYLRQLRNRYTQVVRHSWGAEDVGFLIEQVRAGRGNSAVYFRLGQVLHDHVLRVASWWVLTSMYFVSGNSAAFALEGGPQGATALLPLSPLISWLFSVGTVLLFASIAVDLARFPPEDRSVARVLFELVAMWALLPALSFLFGMLPAIHAQTKLALGLPLSWRVTPKRLRPEPASAR